MLKATALVRGVDVAAWSSRCDAQKVAWLQKRSQYSSARDLVTINTQEGLNLVVNAVLLSPSAVCRDSPVLSLLTPFADARMPPKRAPHHNAFSSVLKRATRFSSTPGKPGEVSHVCCCRAWALWWGWGWQRRRAQTALQSAKQPRRAENPPEDVEKVLAIQCPVVSAASTLVVWMVMCGVGW